MGGAYGKAEVLSGMQDKSVERRKKGVEMKAEKGLGAYESNQLNAKQKYAVIKWIEQNKDGKIDARSKKASNDLGFAVSPSTIATWHHAIHGAIRKPKRPSKESVISQKDLVDMVVSAVMEKINKEMGSK